MNRLLPALVLPLALAACGRTIRPAAVAPDPGAYPRLLRERVDERGRVDYPALAADRARLDAAYAWFAAERPGRDDRLAFWIDAYNLAVLVGVVSLAPEPSVLDVASPFPLGIVAPAGAGFFYFTDFVIDGRETNLHDLEHEVIRGRFADARIHFAINCASAGCPRLERRPWQEGDLDRRLDAATRRFVADPRQVRIDPAGRRVLVSPIFDWFREDFGDVLGFLVRHAGGERRAALARAKEEGWELAFFEYDWSLNAAPE